MTELSRQQSLPQERMLLHELNHRINNEFAAAISVVSLAAARSGSDEVKAALSGVAELLHQYAQVHRALEMPEYDTLIDAAAYLRQLCGSISRSQLDTRKIELVLVAQSLWLPADRCWHRNDRVRVDKQCGSACLSHRGRQDLCGVVARGSIF
jgi:two-component sensor histidine kinase